MNGWYVLLEGIVLSAILYGTCAWGIRNGAVNMVFLYGQDVKDRVVEMGLTTHEKIRAGKKRFASLGLLFYFAYTIVCVFVINGTRGFLPSFLQFTGILLIMGMFDRLYIDWYWVGHTKAWIIPGTEDLMPYIPAKVHLMKWAYTLILYPAIGALLCWIISLFL